MFNDEEQASKPKIITFHFATFLDDQQAENIDNTP